MEGIAQERNTAHKKLKVLRDVQFLLDRLFPRVRITPSYIFFSWRYNPHWGLYFTAL